jgi:hypothetical protein
MADQYVVLGDVAASRKITERRAFRDRLADLCDRVNEAYTESIGAAFTPLKGIDEIGGTLESVEDLYGITKTITAEVRPEVMRLAVVGERIDVRANEGEVSSMDGPAFHRADELLETMDSKGYRFEFEADDERFDALLSGQVNLLLARRESLTDRQREVVATYERQGTQRDVAEELGITQQAVSSALRAAGWPMVGEVEDNLSRALAKYDA